MRNKSDIDKVFEMGKTISNNNIMIKFIDSNSTEFLFAVSSKKFKRAVDRNKIKRMMKLSVDNIFNKVVNKKIAIVYIGNDVPTFESVNNSIEKLLLDVDRY